MNQDPFKDYVKESEPNKRDKVYTWYTAIGLQAVDGLTTSPYLQDMAIANIEGNITIDQAERLLNSYYEENSKETAQGRTEEADKVSVRIAKILSEKAFSFTPNEYISIHRKLFSGIYSHAGKLRDYNITKREWVLDGASVLYGSASELRATMDYDFMKEMQFSYKGLTMEETLHHLAYFVSRLWQIHIFGEGNTRTTAVFFIKYLRMLGFDVTNDIFAENAWYFRNSLVRANYNDIKNGIYETTEYLELFLRNLLLGEQNELHNRSMHIGSFFNTPEKADIRGVKTDIQELSTDIQEPKVDIQELNIDIQGSKTDIQELNTDIQGPKADIQELNTDIQEPKADIQVKSIYGECIKGMTEKTVLHIQKLYEVCGSCEFFGRSDVEAVMGLRSSRASEFLNKLTMVGIIEPVKGHGKGKYRFVEPAEAGSEV